MLREHQHTAQDQSGPASREAAESPLNGTLASRAQSSDTRACETEQAHAAREEEAQQSLPRECETTEGSSDEPGAEAAPEDKRSKKKEKAKVKNLKFDKKKLLADGAETTQASVDHTPADGSTVNWSIEGTAFGATVTNAGVVSGGADITPKEDKARVKVKAVDSKDAKAKATKGINVWNPAYIQGKEDYAKFIAKNYEVKDNVPSSWAGGKFDLKYSPKHKRLSCLVKVKYVFQDGAAKKWTKKQKKRWRSRFSKEIAHKWSGQWKFENKRAPGKVWKKLGPVAVKVRAKEVSANEHFVLTIHKDGVGAAINANNTGDLDQANQRPDKDAFDARAAELKRLKDRTPSPITFLPKSSDIPAADKTKLDFVATYLRALQYPHFKIVIKGEAQKSEGFSTKAAKKMAGTRAKAVKSALSARGVGGHKLKTQTGTTSEQVTVSATIPKYRNVYPVMAHEFGHMLGLDDEYVRDGMSKGDKTDHYALTKEALGEDYADSLAVMRDDSGALMNGGRDVRPHHYVTLWEALGAATETAEVPDPKFTRSDWGFVGFN